MRLLPFISSASNLSGESSLTPDIEAFQTNRLFSWNSTDFFVLSLSIIILILLGVIYRLRKQREGIREHLQKQKNELDNTIFELDRLEAEKSAEHSRTQMLLELKSTENQLIEEIRKSEEKFRILFNFAGDAIFIHNIEGKILEVNQRAFEFLGYSREALLTCNFGEIACPETDAPFSIRMKMLEQRSHLFYETTHIHKNGNRIPVEINSRILEYNGASAVLSIVRDITERARAEREKAELAELLRQAQKMEAIGCLTGGIAHDFNNILQAVLGYTHLAMKLIGKDEKAFSHLEKVAQAGHRATEVVSQMLTFSRQNRQAQTAIEIRPLINEVIELIGNSISPNIEIRTHYGDDCGAILGNPTQIHQVIMNLCANAAYALRDNGGVLEIGLKNTLVTADLVLKQPELKIAEYLVLSVRDTGPGMDKSTKDRIFEPYFTTKKRGEGAGLGLAMVHGIVKIHAGAIVITSDPGEGSLFEIYFPSHAHRIVHKDPHESEEITPTGNERILFVDDEEPIIQLGENALRDLGYTITACAYSVEALEKFVENPYKYDVVITDQIMPHMTGTELATELMKVRADIPIILCTGFSEQITEEQAKAIGIREYLKKPIIEIEMAKAIRRVLDN